MRSPCARYSWFEERDLLLTPTLACTAVPHHRWTGGWIRTSLGVARWIQTAVWNLVSFPAASVPVALSRDRLPIAVQLVARPGAEDTILGAARQISELVSFPSLKG